MATSRRRTIGRVRSGREARGLDGLQGLLVDGDGLVGVGLLEPAGLGDLGADLGVELLGGEGLGVRDHRVLVADDGLALGALSSAGSFLSRSWTFACRLSSSEPPAAATSVRRARARALSPFRMAARADS